MNWDWLSSEWKAITAIIIFLVVIIAAGLMRQYQNSGHFDPVEAVITGFGSNPGYGSSEIIVVATTDEGLVGQSKVEAALVRGCQIGDAVRAEKKGQFVRIYPRPCVK